MSTIAHRPIVMSSSSPSLTCEVITMVAKQLIADNAFATCANLNLTSKKIREATLETLWTHMYWTAYHDPASCKKEEIEAKWKIIKLSRGAKHIKYIIEPALFKSNTGYGEQPIISKSLSKTLKVSITLASCGGSSEIQVHLFGKYAYNAFDMACVLKALNLARTLPSFHSVTEVAFYVHSKPPATPIDKVSPVDAQGNADAANLGNTAKGSPPMRPIFSVPIGEQAWLQRITLDIGKSVKLKDDEFFVVASHVVTFLKPYVNHRVQAKNAPELEEPSIMMVNLKVPELLSFGSAFMRVYDNDPVYATLDIHLNLAYNEETGKPMPTRAQVTELRALFVTAKSKFIRAAGTIPLGMLGSFHASNHRETVYLTVEVDEKRSMLVSSFGLGWSDMEDEQQAL